MSALLNAPVVWILIPSLTAGGLFLLRRRERTIHILGILVALLLAWLAWQLPIGEPLTLIPQIGLPSIRFGDTLTVLGRRFVVNNNTTPTLMMLYLAIALWFGGAYIARAGRLFVPLGLAIAALLTAAVAVTPFLYAALIIELVALVSVPLLSPPGRPLNRGVSRFLVFQTIGMAIILFADWLLPEVELSPLLITPVLRAFILLGLGFALIAAIFPFHTWVPMLAEEAHPYPTAFVLFILPAAISFLGLNYLGRYYQVPEVAETVYTTLRYVGALMVLAGGIWAAVQSQLGRILGFAVLVQIGMGLLALSLGIETDTGAPVGGVFFVQMLPQGLGLALWALSLSILRSHADDLNYRSVKGLARQLPIVSLSLVLANFSLAGLPLLASFPVSVALWSELARQTLSVAILSLIGNLGLLIAGLRTLAVLVMAPPDEPWRVSESGVELILLLSAWVMLFVVGLMPQWFLPGLTDMALTFITTTP